MLFKEYQSQYRQKHCKTAFEMFFTDMSKNHVIFVEPENLQPSQLWISEQKLAQVENELLTCGHKCLKPISVKPIDSKLVITDGHTRVVALIRYGFAAIPCIIDIDNLDWEAYKICIGWCLEEGIFGANRLLENIISHEDYETLWISRCKAMHDDLDRKRMAEIGFGLIAS